MKVSKLFENSDIEVILKKYNITNYTIHPDGIVDVAGDVKLFNKKLRQLPVKFGYVDGDFLCNANRLTSLAGAPWGVRGHFICSYNQLTSLEGGPSEVGNFCCDNNQLTTLQYAPRDVFGSFYCNDNQLTTLRGAPRELAGWFNCSNNKLTDLHGAPTEVLTFFCTGMFTSEPDHSFINIEDGNCIW